MRLKKLYYALGFAVLAALFAVSTFYVSADAGKKYKSLRGSEAWLGIYMQDIDDELAEAFDIQTKEGVLIDGVIDDSPADDAGLRSGDVIVELDGAAILDSDDFSRSLRKHEPGDEVEVKVQRRGRERTYTVELGKEDKYDQARKYYDQAITLHNVPGSGWKSIYIDGDGGYLGVLTIELSDQLADYFVAKFGVLVTEVEENSPAEEAGIQAGDVITAINNEDIFAPSELTEILRDYEEGDQVEIGIVRRGQEMKIPATLDKASGIEWHGSFDHQFLNVPSVPSLPSLPNLLGLQYLQQIDKDDLLHGFDEGEFEEEMKELREELRDLQEELEIIREKLD